MPRRPQRPQNFISKFMAVRACRRSAAAEVIWQFVANTLLVLLSCSYCSNILALTTTLKYALHYTNNHVITGPPPYSDSAGTAKKYHFSRSVALFDDSFWDQKTVTVAIVRHCNRSHCKREGL